MHLQRDERRSLDLEDPRIRALKQAFLSAYVETAAFNRAAAMIGVKYATVKDWIDDARSESPVDKEFAKAFTVARSEAADTVEGEIARRGMEGVPEPVVSQGELVWMPHRKSNGDPLYAYRTKEGEMVVPDPETGNPLELGKDYVIRPLTVRRYSDRLLLARARALMPDKYGFQFPAAAKPTAEKNDSVDEVVIDVREEEAGVLERARKNGQVH